jgi:hypothetical protein
LIYDEDGANGHEFLEDVKFAPPRRKRQVYPLKP